MTRTALVEPGYYLPQPGPMLQAVTKKKHDLEDKYLLGLLSKRQPSTGEREHIDKVLARARRQDLSMSANFLELCLTSAGITEATHRIGARTLEEFKKQEHLLLDECIRVTGLDPRPVLLRNQRMLQGYSKARTAVEPLPPSKDVLNRMVQVARSVVAACPIHDLEQMGHELDAAMLSHRCRKAYEGLVAFTRRHVLELNDQMQTVGRAYAEGRLSLEDVSSILQMSPQEAVALLERCSFCRPFDTIALEPQRRSSLLRAISDEIKASKEWTPPSEDLLNRDVIASQRIEGVDANPWLVQSRD